MEFYDNTRVSGYEGCERKYFFRHHLDLNPKGHAPELTFGIAWHAAMDQIWPMLMLDQSDQTSDVSTIKAGYYAFEKSWDENWDKRIEDLNPDDLDALKARTPTTAIGMLQEYVPLRRQFLERYELLSVERPFVVPLEPDNEELWYCGRLDKVVKNRQTGGVYIVDHKTTTQYKKDGYFRDSFADGFSPDSQMDGYAYAGHILYGDDFKGIYVDGALVHKHVHEGFCWLPVNRHIEQLDQWLHRTLTRVRAIQKDTASAVLSKDGPYLAAFPQRTSNCFAYGRACTYTDLCKSWANPFSAIEAVAEPPLGFEVSRWSPFNEDHLKLIEEGVASERA